MPRQFAIGSVLIESLCQMVPFLAQEHDSSAWMWMRYAAIAGLAAYQASKWTLSTILEPDAQQA